MCAVTPEAESNVTARRLSCRFLNLSSLVQKRFDECVKETMFALAFRKTEAARLVARTPFEPEPLTSQQGDILLVKPIN
jgi:hypothetical protein